MLSHFRRSRVVAQAVLWTALGMSAAFANGAYDREAGEFFLQQYSPKVYSGAPQNWGMVQDARGVMFFANVDGVLQYDSAKWRRVSLNGLNARSLALARDGTVYAGSEDQFGFLRPDQSGQLAFQSLADLVPSAYRRFGNVWSIHVTPAGTWFRTTRYLFYLTPAKQLRTIRGYTFRRGFVLDNEYYVLTDVGLFVVRNLNLVKVAGTEAAAGRSLRSYFRYNGGILAATSEGLFWQGRNGFSEWKTQADGYLKSAVASSCLPLESGRLAIATLRGGLVVLNPDGTLSRIVGRDQGLRSQVIRALYEDHEHGLWMALDRGLARIDIDAPITAFGPREGVAEIVNTIERQSGQLFAGTEVGLSYLTVKNDGAVPSFTPVTGISVPVIALLPAKGELLVGTQHGVYSVSGRLTPKMVLETPAILDLAVSPSNPNIVFAAGRGLFVLERKTNGWQGIRKIDVPGDGLRSVVEDRDGWLWATTRTGALHINWKVEPALIREYGVLPAPTAGWVNAYRLSNGIVLATPKGLRRFDVRLQSFVAEERFGRMFADGSRGVSLLREDAHGDIWITGDAYHGLLRKNRSGGYDWEESPLVRAGVKEVYALHLDGDNVAWASGSDGGLARYRDVGTLGRRTDEILLRLTESLKSKRLIFGGETMLPANTSLPYQENALRFEFAYPHYEDEEHTSYQVRLDGLDKTWSAWSNEPEKEYTNLPEHDYTLRIRARDVYGRVSPETSFPFHMQPPWYRTWWAYVLYTAVSLGLLFLFVKWRLAQMAGHMRKLERVVADRTLEVRKQRDEIQAKEEETEALLLNILPASIAEELRDTGAVQPQAYEDVAVCFTDFVGFTLVSEQLSAQEIVEALHTYFSAFDEIINRYGLEKLKTIGDAYMFVGGLPRPSRSFAVDTVLAAIEMLATAKHLATEAGPGAGWQIRLGIHCGPAVAGVVGTKKFAYDIWGETVNLASRLETNAHPNHVNISEETYRMVKDFVDCEARGPIRTKEGRVMQMYFARQPSQDFESRYRVAFAERPPAVKLAEPLEEGESSHWATNKRS